jgi:hypothetical protein
LVFGFAITMSIDQRLRWALTDPSAFPPTSVAIGAVIGIIVGIWYPRAKRARNKGS